MKKDIKTTIIQFIKFGIVGLSNTAVDFLTFLLLTSLINAMNEPPFVYIAQVLSYAMGILNSYIWNSLWTFRRERDNSFKTAFKFLVVNLGAMLVSVSVLWFFRDIVGVRPLPLELFGLSIVVPANIICKIPASTVAAVADFIGNKLFVFNKNTQGEKEQ